MWLGVVMSCLAVPVCSAVLQVGRGEGSAHMVHTGASRLSISLFSCFTPGFGVTWEITL